MEPLYNYNGITIKQLKDYVKDLPEVDPDTGDDYKIWIEGTNDDHEIKFSNEAISMWPLDKGDILIGID
jgi:hypothetical protein